MRRIELEFSYPEELIARQPRPDFRSLLARPEGPPQEMSKAEILALFQPGDLLVINDTKVECRRVFAGDLEILFVRPLSDLTWEVLFPARELKVGDQVALPGGVTMTLEQKGLPQAVRLSQAVGERYFAAHGEPALPPYIQKARGERHARTEDLAWYQTAWAASSGSCAAPTASLHFTPEDLAQLWARGVEVERLTLHVGLGTFLPIKTDTLSEHVMHEEPVHIPAATAAGIRRLKERGGRLFALGTTVTRALEAWAQGHLTESEDGNVTGSTALFIRPGYEFQLVDVLLTNFHQPGSTLLALVSAFAGLERVREVYAWAIERRFRLFSYGDLSVWTRK